MVEQKAAQVEQRDQQIGQKETAQHVRSFPKLCPELSNWGRSEGLKRTEHDGWLELEKRMEEKCSGHRKPVNTDGRCGCPDLELAKLLFLGSQIEIRPGN